MKSTLEQLVGFIRGELRAEGPDGAGFSDNQIIKALNLAISELAKEFPIRAVVTVTTEDAVNEYSLDWMAIENIIRVTYDGSRLRAVALDDYLAMTAPTEGEVRNWLLWGAKLILTGEVEADKDLQLWVTRPPAALVEKDDVYELPYYVESALIHYALAACYREGRADDSARMHFSTYLKLKDEIIQRAVPQRQREETPQVRSTYFPPISDRYGWPRTDRNPGGNPEV